MICFVPDQRLLRRRSPVNGEWSVCHWNDLLLKKHLFHALLIVAADQSGVVKIALLSGLLLGEDVAVISVLSLDFASTGESETLLGAGFGFQCRHYFTVLIS